MNTVAREILASLYGADAVRLEPVHTGMSGANVYRVIMRGQSVSYMKIGAQVAGDALRDEAARTAWLAEHGLRVPRILRLHQADGHVAMLTEAMAGVPADTSTLSTPVLADALGRGLAALHALPPRDCPFDETLPVRLARAARAVAAGAVDATDFDPRNRGVAAADLLDRLTATIPAEDVVVVHGDATLSNIMIDDAGAAGFIDCGNAGRGDRMIDVALLAADIEEHRSAEAAALFIAAYGARHWDAARARYYLDLYELF